MLDFETEVCFQPVLQASGELPAALVILRRLTKIFHKAVSWSSQSSSRTESGWYGVMLTLEEVRDCDYGGKVFEVLGGL